MTDSGSRHCRSPFAAFQSPRIDLLSVTSRATILNDPSRYGRNREIPDDPYQHEYDVSRVRSIRYKIRVFQCHNILFQHQLENPLKVAPLIQSNLTPVKFFHSFISASVSFLHLRCKFYLMSRFRNIKSSLKRNSLFYRLNRY